MYSEELISILHLFSFILQTRLNESKILHYVLARKIRKHLSVKNPTHAITIGTEPNTLAYVLIYPHKKNYVRVR